MTPLVSIVLPTRNGMRYLDEAVRSVIDQTCRDWELIIVDDASTDETPELIARCETRDGRIRAVRTARNRKLPGALNLGFSLARGEYLTWTSDDNRYRPEALATLVAVLDGRLDVDVVYSDFSRIDGGGNVTGLTRARAPGEILSGNVVGPCFLYRRRVRDVLGGYAEDLFLAEDYDFWLRASGSFVLHPVHRDLYLYRDHGGSLTRNNAFRVLKATERALRRHYDSHPGIGAEARAKGWLALAARASAAGHGRLAGKYLVYAVRDAPARAYRHGVRNACPGGDADGLAARLADSERRIEAMKRTLSWRITAPLRSLKALLKGRSLR